MGGMSRFRVSKVGDGFDEMKVRSVESRNSLHKWKGISLIDSEYGFDQGEVPCIESGDIIPTSGKIRLSKVEIIASITHRYQLGTENHPLVNQNGVRSCQAGDVH